MKNILILFSTLFSVNAFAQEIQKRDFEYNKQEIGYIEISYANKSITNLYIILNSDKKTTKSFSNELINCPGINVSHSRFYLITIPEKIQGLKEKEKIFLEFATHIINTTKLIDSSLHVISDQDYTALYKKISLENGKKYKHGYLNDIKSINLNIDSKNLCKIIKHN